MNASSFARSSASAPPARSRASSSAGSARVRRTTRAFAGRCASAWSIDDRHSGSVTVCRSSSTMTSRLPNAATPFMSSSTASSIGLPVTLEPLQRTPPEARSHPIDRRRNVRPQPNRIVVTGVERDPGQRRVQARAPGTHGGRLAVPGRRRDERQRRIAARRRAPGRIRGRSTMAGTHTPEPRASPRPAAATRPRSGEPPRERASDAVPIVVFAIRAMLAESRSGAGGRGSPGPGLRVGAFSGHERRAAAGHAHPGETGPSRSGGDRRRRRITARQPSQRRRTCSRRITRFST